MLVAAILVLLTGDISLQQAAAAISFDVIFYLMGVFTIGRALEESHALETWLLWGLGKAANIKVLLVMIIAANSVVSIFLMNDTAAIIGTPVLIFLAKKIRCPLIPLLLTLAFTITLSSVTSPVGNPQNLLIANEMENPIVSFFRYLFLPTALNLVVLFFYIIICFRNQLNFQKLKEIPEVPVDEKLAFWAKISVALLTCLIILKAVIGFWKESIALPFSAIAVVAAAPILLFHKKRWRVLKNIDWYTIAFFIALFIFMESVWLSDYFQQLIEVLHLTMTNKGTIVGVSLLLSQFISNVPLVALYLPFLSQGATENYLLLAMASTIAGNCLILGAASNVIIIQAAEKRNEKPFSFLQFMGYGLPLTAIQVGIYWLFF